MKRPLFSELRTIYETTEADPHTFRLTIKLKDLIDEGVLRNAVDRAIERYPYFKVRMVREGADVLFEDNPAPLPIFKTLDRITLGGDQADGHLLAICFWNNRLHLDVYHAMTDGGGIYNFIKTLLYEYCTEFYGIEMSAEDIRLGGSEIAEGEWEDPGRKELSPEREGMVQKWSSPAFQIADGGIANLIPRCIVTNVRIPEQDFMRFNLSNDGSPATIISLLLAKSIETMHPDTEEPIVIAMCVNQRKALSAPLAHQSLVGDVRLVYSNKVKKMPFSRQATCFRGMVALQSDKEMVLDEIRDYQDLMKELENMSTYEERHERCVKRMEDLSRCLTATVSYVGKTGMGEAERYIQEFDALPSTALPSSHTPLTIELAAMNGYFFVNFIQDFVEMDYFNHFIKQLRDNNIDYDVLNRHEALYPLMDMQI